jgi:putative ABC transport system permease protein
MPADYFARRHGMVNKTNGAQVRFVNQDNIDESIRQLGEVLKQDGIKVGGSFTFLDFLKQAKTQFQPIALAALGIALLVAVIGSLGLAGTMSINVVERYREIGIMRSMGAGDRAIIKIFLYEGQAICLFSWAAAAVISLTGSYPLCRMIADMTKCGLHYTYSWSGLLLWLAISIVLGAGSTIFAARQACKISVRDNANCQKVR